LLKELAAYRLGASHVFNFCRQTPLLLLLGSGWRAADPTQLAETGGFFLGNASRCGVAVERVESAGKVITARRNREAW
jgi:hypothetical protein